MTNARPNTKFLDNLDEATLRQVCSRLDALEPYIAEHRDLVKRRRALEIRLGKISKSDRVRQLLAHHPNGLTRAVIGDKLDITVGLSGVLGELKRQGHIDQPGKGLYRLTDLGHQATSSMVVNQNAT